MGKKGNRGYKVIRNGQLSPNSISLYDKLILNESRERINELRDYRNELIDLRDRTVSKYSLTKKLQKESPTLKRINKEIVKTTNLIRKIQVF